MRCAASAHTLPVDTTRSHDDRCASLALRAASRRRATFCCGVSLGGALESRFRVEVGLEDAWGVAEVKRVGSGVVGGGIVGV